MPSSWTLLRAAVDPLARAINTYTAYRLNPAEYVATTFDLTLDGARDYLTLEGYIPQYLSAAKRHPETGQLHDLSYRLVPLSHPDKWNDHRFAAQQCQYHVHVFEREEYKLDWYSHYEVRPFANPVIHYRPTYGTTYLHGVSNLDL